MMETENDFIDEAVSLGHTPEQALVFATLAVATEVIALRREIHEHNKKVSDNQYGIAGRIARFITGS